MSILPQKSNLEIGQLIETANVKDGLNVLRCDGRVLNDSDYPDVYNTIGDYPCFDLTHSASLSAISSGANEITGVAPLSNSLTLIAGGRGTTSGMLLGVLDQTKSSKKVIPLINSISSLAGTVKDYVTLNGEFIGLVQNTQATGYGVEILSNAVSDGENNLLTPTLNLYRTAGHYSAIDPSHQTNYNNIATNGNIVAWGAYYKDPNFPLDIPVICYKKNNSDIITHANINFLIQQDLNVVEQNAPIERWIITGIYYNNNKWQIALKSASSGGTQAIVEINDLESNDISTNNRIFWSFTGYNTVTFIKYFNNFYYIGISSSVSGQNLMRKSTINATIAFDPNFSSTTLPVDITPCGNTYLLNTSAAVFVYNPATTGWSSLGSTPPGSSLSAKQFATDSSGKAIYFPATVTPTQNATNTTINIAFLSTNNGNSFSTLTITITDSTLTGGAVMSGALNIGGSAKLDNGVWVIYGLAPIVRKGSSSTLPFICYSTDFTTWNFEVLQIRSQFTAAQILGIPITTGDKYLPTGSMLLINNTTSITCIYINITSAGVLTYYQTVDPLASQSFRIASKVASNNLSSVALGVNEMGQILRIDHNSVNNTLQIKQLYSIREVLNYSTVIQSLTNNIKYISSLNSFIIVDDAQLFTFNDTTNTIQNVNLYSLLPNSELYDIQFSDIDADNNEIILPITSKRNTQVLLARGSNTGNLHTSVLSIQLQQLGRMPAPNTDTGFTARNIAVKIFPKVVNGVTVGKIYLSIGSTTNSSGLSDKFFPHLVFTGETTTQNNRNKVVTKVNSVGMIGLSGNVFTQSIINFDNMVIITTGNGLTALVEDRTTGEFNDVALTKLGIPAMLFQLNDTQVMIVTSYSHCLITGKPYDRTLGQFQIPFIPNRAIVVN